MGCSSHFLTRRFRASPSSSLAVMRTPRDVCPPLSIGVFSHSPALAVCAFPVLRFRTGLASLVPCRIAE